MTGAASSPAAAIHAHRARLIRLRAGATAEALSAFAAALERGYPVNMLAHDPQLRAVRDDRRFKEMIGGGKRE